MDIKLLALWTKVKSLAAELWTKLNADLAKLWAEDKVFLIAFGVIILTLKFRAILINLIVSNAKSIFGKAQNQSDALSTQENTDNAAANALVQQADQLPSTEAPVQSDWYEHEK